MLLRDVMMPLPLRADWGQDMEWPYPGIPASLVASFAGHKVAGLPFFAPETVTTDHGSVYKNHHLVEVQRVIGANILPSRVLRPTDKQAVERAFSGIQSLLLEMLLGWRGIDTADRGADPEADAVLTVAQAEHLIATWIVKIWQNRELGEYAPAWDPGTRHSPNTLFAAAMSPGRVRAADPRAGPVLRAAPGAPGEDPRPPRGEDPRAVVRRPRRWTPTGPAPRLRAARPGAGGRSAASPVTGATSSSATRSPMTGTRCGGPGCPPRGRCRPSATSAPMTCCAPPARPAFSPGRMPSCCRCCWTWWAG